MREQGLLAIRLGENFRQVLPKFLDDQSDEAANELHTRIQAHALDAGHERLHDKAKELPVVFDPGHHLADAPLGLQEKVDEKTTQGPELCKPFTFSKLLVFLEPVKLYKKRFRKGCNITSTGGLRGRQSLKTGPARISACSDMESLRARS